MKRTERLTVKVLPAHKAAIERMAKADGEHVAVIMRRLIRAEAQRRGVWPVQERAAEEVAR